jgi:hypothetical protein
LNTDLSKVNGNYVIATIVKRNKSGSLKNTITSMAGKDWKADDSSDRFMNIHSGQHDLQHDMATPIAADYIPHNKRPSVTT